MNANKFRIPTTEHFIKGAKSETLKGVNFVVYDGECKEMGRENKLGAMPTCYCLTYVLPALSSQFSVFSKLCIMNTFCIFSLCYVSHAVFSGMYPSVGVS